ncbi:hypothetical protein GCM10027093_11440 [Paraburkholderia jirisanensis]
MAWRIAGVVARVVADPRCGAQAALPSDGRMRGPRETRRSANTRRSKRGKQRARAAIFSAILLRRRKMQHDRREPRQTFEAARRVQIADQRRDARRAQRCATFGMAGQRKDMGAVL